MEVLSVFIRRYLCKNNKNVNIFEASFNLFSGFVVYGPLKIFYGQRVAHMYIGKKEAILENVYAKNEKNISIFRY